MTADAPAMLLRVDEAARALSISRTMAYQEITSGRLRSVTIGRSRRVPVEALEEYVASLQEQDGAA